MSQVNKLLCVLGFVGTTLTLVACDSSESAVNDPRLKPPLVRVAEVKLAEERERGFTGQVAARVQSNLTFRVAGKVTERLVDAGQTIHRGQPLMRLDRTNYEHAVVAQRGSVAAAKASLVQATADQTRYQALVKSGAVSQSAYDRATAAADSARALLEAAEAQLNVAKNEDQYATLVADAEGIIMETLAEPGQFVAAGQVVMRLAQAGPREAAIYLPETLRPTIGSKAEASLYGVEKRFPAQLRQLSDTADPLTRTFEARYVLGKDAASAPLGATVTIHIPVNEKSENLAVPLGAIDDRGDGPGVWIVTEGENSTVSFRHISLVQVETERAIVRGDIHYGEHIIALGGHALHEGQSIQLTRQDEVSK